MFPFSCNTCLLLHCFIWRSNYSNMFMSICFLPFLQQIFTFLNNNLSIYFRMKFIFLFAPIILAPHYVLHLNFSHCYVQSLSCFCWDHHPSCASSLISMCSIYLHLRRVFIAILLCLCILLPFYRAYASLLHFFYRFLLSCTLTPRRLFLVTLSSCLLIPKIFKDVFP